MKANTATFREISVVRFFEPNIMQWNPSTAPVAVRDIGSNEIFTIYESQLKRIPIGRNENGQEDAIWGYIQERVGRRT
jgi:hypothetical protein